MARRSRQAQGTRARVPVAAGIASAAVAVAGAAAYERGTQRRRAQKRRFGLHGEAPFGQELRRSLAARLDGAIDGLEDRRRDRVVAVHDARTSIKRIRTVLRLGRSQLGESRYRDENDALRSVSQHLASLRDAMVMPAAFEGLLDHYGDDVDGDEVVRLRARLAARGEAVRGDAAEQSVAAAVAALRAVREHLDDWPLTRDEASLEPVLDGFRRAYSRAQKGYRRAHADPDTEALHAWRRRVKDVRYGAELLRDADPSRLKQTRRDAGELSDLLGDDHDLAMLAEVASDCPSTLRLIDRRRQDLQRSAFAVAERVFARTPRKVAKRTRRRARKRTAWR